MGMREVAAALQRVEAVFQKRPSAAVSDDAPAAARWSGGTRVVASHANGTRVETDMPVELGGTGDRVSPGWLFRASIATCAVTSIAFVAAARGVELEVLEVEATSRSDARGMLGMAEADGSHVYAGPGDMRLGVRIRAKGESAERLRALVEDAIARSPIPSAVQTATPLALAVELA